MPKAAPTECSTIVIARDLKSHQIISIKTNSNSLWPANRELVPVKVSIQAEDA
jgi:hypothetical protein